MIRRAALFFVCAVCLWAQGGVVNGVANQAVARPTHAYTTTNPTLVDADCGKRVTFSNASAVTVTLPQAGASGSFLSGCWIDMVNIGAGTATVSPTISTLTPAVALTTNQGAVVNSDGTNYTANLGAGSGGSVTAGDNISTARGAGIVDFTPLDPTVLVLWDDFYPNATGSGSIGLMGWVGNGATPAFLNGVANHPGILKITTGTTNGNQANINIGGSTGFDVFQDLTAFTSWEMQFIVKLGQTTNCSAFVGLVASAYVGADPAAHAYFIRYDTASSDTNWTAHVRFGTGASHSEISTGVAATTTDWFKLRIRSNATGTLLFSAATNNGAFSAEKTACASGCDIGATMDTQPMSPYVQIITRTGSAANIQVDWFGAKVRGLAR